jgi:hypothetical protein
MTTKEWVIAAPKKMYIEPPPPPPEPVFTRWQRFCYYLYTGPGLAVKWLQEARVDPKVVDKTPIVSVFLLEAANVQQIFRMWSTWTAAGQSITAWLSVNLALWLWLNFYLVFNRENKFAIWGTAVGIGLNGLVILSVFYFRYIVGAG